MDQAFLKLRDGDMRQGHNSKRSRGRSGGRRNGSPRHQSFDSNGPSIRIRGNAHQVYEKYLQLARDANVAGDRIAAENMYQHAEHYYRLINVDDGDSQRQHRGDSADQRQNQRNAQHVPDGSPSVPDGGQHGEQASRSESGADLNGSSDKRGDGAAEPKKQNAEVGESSDEPRRERPARRSRRSNGRQRSEAATAEAMDTKAVAEPVGTESVEQGVVVESESAAESAETDANEIH